MDLSFQQLAKHIEHTRVKGQDDLKEITGACEKALVYNFGAVCVNPFFVQKASGILKGSGVEVCTGIGYPLGAGLLEIKAQEMREVIKLGADAVDFVISVAAVKSGMMDVIEREMKTLVSQSEGAITKAIIETCYLTPDEIFRVSRIAAEHGVQYIKTSTGMGPRGASLEDIGIIKKAVAGRCRIKASGGIRSVEEALAFLNAGAERLGTSNGDSIVDSFKERYGV